MYSVASGENKGLRPVRRPACSRTFTRRGGSASLSVRRGWMVHYRMDRGEVVGYSVKREASPPFGCCAQSQHSVATRQSCGVIANTMTARTIGIGGGAPKWRRARHPSFLDGH